jgi:hypothetical protein
LLTRHLVIMPGPFKIGAPRTDAVCVSDTVVNETTNPLLDGEAPRLGTGSVPMLPNVPPPASVFSNVDSGPTLPLVSQVLTDGSAPTLPTLPVSAPTPPAPTTESAADMASGEPRHPMAHLVPEKMKPSEASLRAAEARNVKKKKAKKVKIVVGVCALAVTVVVGPPLANWTIDAINEAGSTQEDEPAEAPAEQPAADTGSDPQSTPSVGVQAIDDAEQLTSASTPPLAP